jgi:hypothetical protein
MKVLRELVKRQTCATVLVKILHQPLTSIVSCLARLAKAGFIHGSKWGREKVFTLTEPVREILSRDFGSKAQGIFQKAVRMQKRCPEMDKEMALVESVCSSGFPLVVGQSLETLVTRHVYPNGSSIERVPGNTYTLWAFLPAHHFSLTQIIGRGPHRVERGSRMWKASRKEVEIWLNERIFGLASRWKDWMKETAPTPTA